MSDDGMRHLRGLDSLKRLGLYSNPNLTDAVRKSYILQYAPDGAVCRSDADERSGLQNDPARQYEVLRGGEPVPVPA